VVNVGNQKQTSIRVDEDAWQQFKLQAIKTKKPLYRLLNEVLTEYLGKVEE